MLKWELVNASLLFDKKSCLKTYVLYLPFPIDTVVSNTCCPNFFHSNFKTITYWERICCIFLILNNEIIYKSRCSMLLFELTGKTHSLYFLLSLGMIDIFRKSSIFKFHYCLLEWNRHCFSLLCDIEGEAPELGKRKVDLMEDEASNIKTTFIF